MAATLLVDQSITNDGWLIYGAVGVAMGEE
jgi:hypothetical protein